MGAYRSPEFAFDHIFAEGDDFTLLTVESGLLDPNLNDSGLFRIIDDQHARSTQIKAIGPNPIDIQIDRVSGSQKNYTRIIIPEGHNLNGWDVRTFGGPATTPTDAVSSIESVVSNDRIDFTFTEDPDGADRFQLIRFTSSPADDLTISFPEIYLTNTIVPLRGPDRKWDARLIKNQQRFKGASGVGTSQRSGADQQSWGLTWKLVQDADVADFMDPLVAAVRPFWFRPPDDDFDWDLYELAGNAGKKENFRANSVGSLVYDLTITLVQVLG